MSIASKIQSIKDHLADIFNLCEEHGVPHAENQNLQNLEDNLEYYFTHTPGGKQYTIVDYAQSDGYQYIDTGIKMRNNIAIELKFILNNWSGNESLGGFSTQNIDFNILKNYNDNFITSTNLNETYTIGAVDNNIHNIIYNTYGKRLLFDDMQKTFIRNVEQQGLNENLLIFANSAQGIKPSGKIYSCKIYNNETGEILRFFIPVEDDNDTICFFDAVTQQFYYSAGELDFF